MRGLMLALLLVGACKGAEEPGRNTAQSAGDSSSGSPTGSGSGKGDQDGRPPRLTGLWEAGQAPRKSQLCMTGEGNKGEFGVIVAAAAGASCAGAGKALRSGDRLTLTMAGDRSCAIEARIEGSVVILPASVPEGCSYYCAQGARLADIRLERAGSTRADALKAQDPAGDPLCG